MFSTKSWPRHRYHWTLPNREIDGVWESLVLEPGIKQLLLNYTLTTLQFSDKMVDSTLISFNRYRQLPVMPIRVYPCSPACPTPHYTTPYPYHTYHKIPYNTAPIITTRNE